MFDRNREVVNRVRFCSAPGLSAARMVKLKIPDFRAPSGQSSPAIASEACAAKGPKGPLGSEGPSPEGDGFGRHKHAQSAEADFRSRPDRRLSAAVLRRFRSLRDLLKASPKGEGFHPSPMGTLNMKKALGHRVDTQGPVSD